MQNADVIIVGAGPAGSSAAIRLAQNGINAILIDRGMPVGSKNLSGGVLWGNDLAEIIPNWQEEAPLERYIINKKVGFLSHEDATVIDMHFDEWNNFPNAGWSLLRAPFDEWLAFKAQEAGASVLSGINITELIEEDGKILGVKQGNEELRAIGIFTCISHRKQMLLFMFEIKVFVWELSSIYGLTACTCSMSEVSGLSHKSIDYSMKLGIFIV